MLLFLYIFNTSHHYDMFQVVDNFFVKKVQDVKESAAYLTVMTRYLQKLYQVSLSLSAILHHCHMWYFLTV